MNLWAALSARTYEVFPLICPDCGGQMRVIAFITFSADIHKILAHIGMAPETLRINPARGPPLWEDCGAQETGEGVEAEPDWDMANQPLPDYPDDQTTSALRGDPNKCGHNRPLGPGYVCESPLRLIVATAAKSVANQPGDCGCAGFARSVLGLILSLMRFLFLNETPT